MRRGPLLLILLFLALPMRATSYGDFDVSPPQSWIDIATVDAAQPVPADDVRWGIYDLLSDEQVRVSGAVSTRYHRIARRVLSSGGVQNASELELNFDPSYEQIVLHDVRLIRGGVSTKALDPASVRVIENEADADNGIYDGRMTVLVFLNDVRPGDVIDYSWTTIGANPLLEGKYVDDFDFSPAVPTARIRHRVLIDSSRPLTHRASSNTLHPAITTTGNTTAYVWEERNVAPAELDDETPSWFQPWRTVQVSEYASWSDVAAWARPLFAISPSAKKAVAALAERIRSEHPERDDQLVAAIRFVQDDVRYLGIEMGRNSHEPRQPDDTLAQRWGDCKDKSLLLVALLRELGVDAWPALVNTRLGRTLDSRLPSPFSFDHVITLVEDRGRQYWIDGTIGDQGGTLGHIDTPTDERALLVRDGVTGLTTIERRSNASIKIEETYRINDDRTSAGLEIVTNYTGAEADAMRALLAAMSPRDLARERLNLAAAAHPRIAATSPPAVTDDRKANTIVVREQYRVRELGEQWIYRAREIESYAVAPLTVVRTMPLAVDYPLDITQTATFVFPDTIEFQPESQTVETPALRLRYSSDRNGNALIFRYHLTATRDSVAAADVATHVRRLDDIHDLAVFDVPAMKPPKAAPAKLHWGWGAAAAGLFLLVCSIALRPARWRRENAQQQHAQHASFRPGEAPASAIPVGDLEEISLHANASTCRCGNRVPSDGDLQQARYGDGELVILTRLCAGCGTEQSMYFSFVPPDASRPARSA